MSHSNKKRNSLRREDILADNLLENLDASDEDSEESFCENNIENDENSLISQSDSQDEILSSDDADFLRKRVIW
jgi:hypothetical protein